MRHPLKKIVIILTTETSGASKSWSEKSYWEGVSDHSIPFTIVVGIEQDENAIKNLLKIAENPCYVINVPKADFIFGALPIVKQRLCEIMQNPNKYPRAQKVSRPSIKTSNNFQYSAQIEGLPVCGAEFRLFVDYHIGQEWFITEIFGIFDRRMHIICSI